MIKAVIFDLDGVIVSTDELHYKAWKKMADKENVYFDEKINNNLRGISREKSLEIILKLASKKYSDEEKAQLMKYKNEIYIKSLKTITPNDILPKIKSILNMLKEKKIKIAIGSSSKNAKLILKQIGLLDYFDAISDGTNITFSKPHPEVFLKAASMLHVSPSNCGVVEDALSGIEAAKNANMVAFATGDALHSNLKDYDLESLLLMV
jgi:beta-phosphoglucomutase